MTNIQQQILDVLENINVVALISTPNINITCNDIDYFLSGKAGTTYRVRPYNFKTVKDNETVLVYFRKELKFIIRRNY